MGEEEPGRPWIDLAAIDVKGGEVERLTTYEELRRLPDVSADGKWLVFCSNRGGGPHETNLFLAQWKQARDDSVFGAARNTPRPHAS